MKTKELNLLIDYKKELLNSLTTSQNYTYVDDTSLTYHDDKNDITVSIIHIEDRNMQNTYFQVRMDITWKKFQHKTKFNYSSKGGYLDTISTTLSDNKDYRKKLDEIILSEIYSQIENHDFNQFKRVR